MPAADADGCCIEVIFVCLNIHTFSGKTWTFDLYRNGCFSHMWGKITTRHQNPKLLSIMAGRADAEHFRLLETYTWAAGSVRQGNFIHTTTPLLEIYGFSIATLFSISVCSSSATFTGVLFYLQCEFRMDDGYGLLNNRWDRRHDWHLHQ